MHKPARASAFFYMQHPQRARMARAAVCMLYTLTDGTGAPQQRLLTYYTIHMEQHPLRARMAHAAVCRLYPLTDGTGAPTANRRAHTTIGMEQQPLRAQMAHAMKVIK